MLRAHRGDGIEFCTNQDGDLEMVPARARLFDAGLWAVGQALILSLALPGGAMAVDGPDSLARERIGAAIVDSRWVRATTAEGVRGLRPREHDEQWLLAVLVIGGCALGGLFLGAKVMGQYGEWVPVYPEP